MKVGRNEPCYCGSENKFKHCCGKDNDSDVIPFQKEKSLLIKFFIALFFGIIIYAFVSWMQTGVEMELYKCNDPNCAQWHQRPKTSSN